MLITLVGVFLISGIFSDEFRFKADSVFLVQCMEETEQLGAK